MKDLQLTSDWGNRTVLVRWTTTHENPQEVVDQFIAQISSHEDVETTSCNVGKKGATIIVDIRPDVFTGSSDERWNGVREFVKRIARETFGGK